MYPLKGISSYCLELVKSIPRDVKVDFIGFDKLCPEFIYPGGTKIPEADYYIPKMDNVKIRPLLTYYNPISWIWAGLTAKGELIHAQWWDPLLFPIFFPILLIGKIRRKKIVITVHDVTPHEHKKLGTFLNKVIFAISNKYIVHTEDNKKVLAQIYRIDSNKICVIPCGLLDIACPQNVPSHQDTLKKLGLSLEKKYLLHFGYIRDYKGLDVLLKALSIVIRQRKDINLIIIGPNWENEKKYEDLIHEYNLREYIINKIGYIPDSELILNIIAADLIVFPYKYFNSQSAAGMLALAYHKPILVTKVGGLIELVKSEEMIVQPNDPNELADRILFIFNNPGTLDKSALASEEISANYHWDRIGKKLQSLYRM